MALFGTSRDASLFRHLNKEIINNIIETVVDVYKMDIKVNKSNMYGEVEKRIWLDPVRFACLIAKDEPSDKYEEAGYDKAQTIKFSILRDELVEKDFVIEAGDVFHWNNIYWEIDHVLENQFLMGRNPDTNKQIDDEWGWNVSVSVLGHMTDRKSIQIENTFTGTNKNEAYM